MARVRAVVDDGGRILAAQFDVKQEEPDERTPLEELLPSPGQRRVDFEVADEIAQLSADDLEHFFSHAEVTWPAEVRTQPIEIVRHSHD